MSFLIYEAKQRLSKNPLMNLNKLIDWKPFKEALKVIHNSVTGPHGYDVLSMFKAMILQSWHQLSDPELEESLMVRLDFMAFTGLHKVPDETTLCRFRGKLIKHGLLEKLLCELNHQLEHHHLKVKESKGAIVDATIISSAARPHKTLETQNVESEDSSPSYQVTVETTSIDQDASWFKKGRHSFYGYKGFAVVDAEDGYIEHVHVTSAHVSEIKELEKIVAEVSSQRRFYGDKGYASQNNRDLLKQHGFKNGIMYKASKNKPLSLWEKRFNKAVSKVRFKVEQCFGTLKRLLGFHQASYYGIHKVQAQMLLKAFVFNCIKALNKLKTY